MPPRPTANVDTNLLQKIPAFAMGAGGIVRHVNVLEPLDVLHSTWPSQEGARKCSTFGQSCKNLSANPTAPFVRAAVLCARTIIGLLGKMVTDAVVQQGCRVLESDMLSGMVKYPFSNGTEGYAWMDVWCDECANDHTMHGPDSDGPGCPIMAKSLLHEPIEEWDEYTNEKGDFFMPPAIVCREFKQCEKPHPHGVGDLRDEEGRTHAMWASEIRLKMPTIRRAERQE